MDVFTFRYRVRLVSVTSFQQNTAYLTPVRAQHRGNEVLLSLYIRNKIFQFTYPSQLFVFKVVFPCGDRAVDLLLNTLLRFLKP